MRREIYMSEVARPLWVLEQAVTVLIDGQTTAGAYAMVEQVVPAAGGLPFLHSFPVQATFYVASGRFEFYQMNQRGKKKTLITSPRSLIRIPRGSAHGFRNVGMEAGRLLVTFEPAGTITQLFTALDRLAGRGREGPVQSHLINLCELIEVFQKHELRIFEAPDALY